MCVCVCVCVCVLIYFLKTFCQGGRLPNSRTSVEIAVWSHRILNINNNIQRGFSLFYFFPSFLLFSIFRCSFFVLFFFIRPPPSFNSSNSLAFIQIRYWPQTSHIPIFSLSFNFSSYFTVYKKWCPYFQNFMILYLTLLLREIIFCCFFFIIFFKKFFFLELFFIRI